MPREDNKILSSYWEGPVSNLEILSIKSFVKNGHTVLVYTYDEKVKSFDKNMIVLDASEIISKKQRISFIGPTTSFSDFFRFFLLYKFGGWWVDLDTVLLKQISTENPVEFSMHFSLDKKRPDLNSTPLKLTKGHPIAELFLKEILLSDLNYLKHGLGPRFLNKKINEFKLSQYIVSSDIYSPIGWAEIHRIIEPGFGFDRISPETVAIHIFNYAFSGIKKIDKNGVYSPDSLYEFLKKKYF